ncbi:MAG: NADH-quinone oxidoreductase subunit C [Longimicrobiales bacterium]|nr:NADH-quinone oxidoreductase subunit C [Longimicrobiales bacterium]
MSVTETHGGSAVATPPVLQPDAFFELLRGAATGGGRVVALFGTGAAPGAELVAVVATDPLGLLRIARTRTPGGDFPSLTPHLPQVHLFEREIREQTGLVPTGHPWLKPVRFTRPGDTIGVMDFFAIEGESVHEVGVGPVHAGIIEPGHFRFQCHGETVFHLEISLGYQHRGVERALLQGPGKRALHLAETLAGDTTIGHATAYCDALEALADVRVPPRAQAIRAVALELERLANHIGDLGAMAGDVAFLPTASYCGRIRGDFLNLTASICGNRFGRSLVVPGGVAFDITPAMADDLGRRLAAAERDAQGAVDLLWDAPSVMARFEDIGVVPAALASELGLVGPAARAAGLSQDVRHDHPSGLFKLASIPLSTASRGDVYSRARVRWLECVRSIAFVREALATLPQGPVLAPMRPLRPDRIVTTLVEGWRGEIAHVVGTDHSGRISRYKVVDPSFHNWMGLAMALRDQAISDFPLCNKSFNLSYCGHDL